MTGGAEKSVKGKGEERERVGCERLEGKGAMSRGTLITRWWVVVEKI